MKRYIVSALFSLFFLLLTISSANALSKYDFVQYVGKNVDLEHAWSEYRVCNPTVVNFTIPYQSVNYFQMVFNKVKGDLKDYWLEIKDNTTCYKIINNFTESCSPYIAENSTLINNCTTVDNSYLQPYQCEQWQIFNPVGFTAKAKTCYNIRIHGTYDIASKGREVSIDNVLSFAGYTFNEYDWWNVSFTKKKPIHINYVGGSNATLSNYNYYIEVDYEPDMQSDFSDLRFLDEGETSQLNYFIEKNTTSSKAYITIKIPQINNTANYTVWMYYGSNDVTTTSNCPNTFPFCDNFENQAIYNMTSRNPATFSRAETWTDTANPYERTQDVIVYNTASNGNFYFNGFKRISDQFIWRTIFQTNATAQEVIYFGGTNEYLTQVGWNSGYWGVVLPSGWVDVGWKTNWDKQQVAWEMIVNDTAKVWTANITFVNNGTKIGNTNNYCTPFNSWAKAGCSYYNNATWTDDTSHNGFALNTWNVGGVQTIDLVTQRYYVMDEPTYPNKISFGAEQSQTVPSIAITVNYTDITFSSLSAGIQNQSSDEDYKINVSVLGGCSGEIKLSALNPLTYSSYEIGLGNFTFNYTLNINPYPTLLTLDTNRTIAVNDGDSIYPKYYLSVPTGQYAGSYTTTHYVEAYCV